MIPDADWLGVWRVESVTCEHPQPFARKRLRHLVMTSNEMWEVYTWPLKFDDEPGAPWRYTIIGNALSRSRHALVEHAVVALTDSGLQVRWADGCTYDLTREEKPAVEASAGIRPSPPPRPVPLVEHFGDLSYYPERRVWGSEVVISGRAFAVEIHSVADERRLDRGDLDTARQCIESLRAVGVETLLQRAAGLFLEEWLCCIQDDVPPGQPTVDELARELIVNGVSFDNDNAFVEVDCGDGNWLRGEWKPMGTAMGSAIAYDCDWNLLYIVSDYSAPLLIE